MGRRNLRTGARTLTIWVEIEPRSGTNDLVRDSLPRSAFLVTLGSTFVIYVDYYEICNIFEVLFCASVSLFDPAD